MGASTCFHLASQKVTVLGLEQFDVPHSRGSSHGYSRMIRKAYPDHPDVQIACGFSGHGFKFASVIGQALAHAAISGRSDPSLDFLRLR